MYLFWPLFVCTSVISAISFAVELSIDWPTDHSLVWEPVAVAIDVDLVGDSVDTMLLCMMIDDSDSSCQKLESAELPILTFLRTSDSTPRSVHESMEDMQHANHSLTAWLESSSSSSSSSSIEISARVRHIFHTWRLSFKENQFAVQLGNKKHIYKMDMSIDTPFDDMELLANTFIVQNVIRYVQYSCLRAVEMPFQRSGKGHTRTVCHIHGATRSVTQCLTFAFLETLLEQITRKPICVAESLDSESDGKLAKLLVLGSSSAWVFCDARSFTVQMDARGGVWCRGIPDEGESSRETTGMNVRAVPGASALGLGNNDSLTGATVEFQRRLQDNRAYDVVILLVGEVDRSAAIWRRASRDATSIASQIDQAVNRTISFLNFFLPDGIHRKNVIIIGSPLPTVTRLQFLEQVHPDLVEEEVAIETANESRFASRTHFSETALTLRFNEALRFQSKANGFRYGDLTDDTLDFTTGFVNDFFQSPETDTHLHLERSHFFWRKAVIKASDGFLKWC